ncbi:exodeoxyribonuclease VII large subunit [Candidatus Parcubacteria bacterium]|nr:exodeoxyribonuclease VII large subunit [Candidatus Parcubacteria bacterium]
MEYSKDKIFSVSEYIDILNTELKKYRAKIIGEVSEISFGPTGHVYFSLKDEKDGSIIKCIIWKSIYSIYGIKLKIGDKIIAFGSPSMHPLYGFSFIAETIEYAGEGTLEKEYKRLKKKLTEQGAFAEIRKRPILKYPQKIGVITSRQGAVLADFLNNLGKFGFKIKMIDSRVEGQVAVADLLSSIRTFVKQDIDVLVIIRGGGSLESMMAFNNELLVMEIVNFPVPVVLGIGHHKNEPLAALAADVSVSTPTAAANLLNESWKHAMLLLEKHERDTIGFYGNVLENVNISIKNSWEKSVFGFKSLLSTISQRLEHSVKIIELNNPERQLRLGYSIASHYGKIIKRVDDAKIGENIDLRVIDGKIISEVKNIHPVK